MAKETLKEDLVLKKDIQYMKEAIDKGFKGVHLRQDVANGKLQKHELQINTLEERDANFITKENYLRDKVNNFDKFKWILVGLLTGALVSQIFSMIGG